MVIEYIRYIVDEDWPVESENAYRRASAVLDADPHCLAYEVAQGMDERGRFIVRIEWDSQEGHEQGFRNSARFAEFFGAVEPFFAQIEEMRHYTVLLQRSRLDQVETRSTPPPSHASAAATGPRA
ncbi:MAG: putative quinol monooxygenase [Ilumatobacteraceae bacterium]